MRFIVGLAATVAAVTQLILAAPPPPKGPPRGYHNPPKRNCDLDSTFTWTSSQPLIGPTNDTRNIAALKDPSIVYYDGKYHVFVSTAQASGYNLAYLSFTDFVSAHTAPLYYLDQSDIGEGYRAAPEVFYFAPQKLWYLVYQNGNAAYSTNPDINDPSRWTAPEVFYPDGMPQIFTDNIGDGYWVDMWVICDERNCFLFSSDDNGHLYRSQTSIRDFPEGFDEPAIALQDEENPQSLFEASNVYKVGRNEYLLLVEAIGSDGYRYFRSWTSDAIDGEWTELTASESVPFARSNNVAFFEDVWTTSISHGEVVRDMVDQTLTIRPCGLEYLYQGLTPDATGDYNSLPWKLALLTQIDGICS